MPKTSIIINSQDTLGKSTQRSFTDVNPKAQNSDLATFGQRLTAMTSNVHGGTIRIDKTDCDNETKSNRTFTKFMVTKWNESASQVNVYQLENNENELTVKLATDTSKSYSLSARMGTTFDTPPYITDLSFSSADTDLSVTASTYTWHTAEYSNAGLRECWAVNLVMSRIVPCTVTATICFDETDTCNAYERTLTWTVTELE